MIKKKTSSFLIKDILKSKTGQRKKCQRRVESVSKAGNDSHHHSDTDHRSTTDESSATTAEGEDHQVPIINTIPLPKSSSNSEQETSFLQEGFKLSRQAIRFGHERKEAEIVSTGGVNAGGLCLKPVEPKQASTDRTPDNLSSLYLHHRFPFSSPSLSSDPPPTSSSSRNFLIDSSTLLNPSPASSFLLEQPLPLSSHHWPSLPAINGANTSSWTHLGMTQFSFSTIFCSLSLSFNPSPIFYPFSINRKNFLLSSKYNWIRFSISSLSLSLSLSLAMPILTHFLIETVWNFFEGHPLSWSQTPLNFFLPSSFPLSLSFSLVLKTLWFPQLTDHVLYVWSGSLEGHVQSLSSPGAIGVRASVGNNNGIEWNGQSPLEYNSSGSKSSNQNNNIIRGSGLDRNCDLDGLYFAAAAAAAVNSINSARFGFGPSEDDLQNHLTRNPYSQSSLLFSSPPDLISNQFRLSTTTRSIQSNSSSSTSDPDIVTTSSPSSLDDHYNNLHHHLFHRNCSSPGFHSNHNNSNNKCNNNSSVLSINSTCTSFLRTSNTDRSTSVLRSPPQQQQQEEELVIGCHSSSTLHDHHRHQEQHGDDGYNSNNHQLHHHHHEKDREDERGEERGGVGESNNQRKIRRNRTVFTELQLMGLERRFDSQKYLSTPDRSDLARILGLTQLQVKTWYQVSSFSWILIYITLSLSLFHCWNTW